MMKGMSLIIIGGLITSTLLILLLLPSFYLLMSKDGRAQTRERKRLKKEAKKANKK
jgi:HAE1 family hydrophobic/amphiphilic exporter-1